MDELEVVAHTLFKGYNGFDDVLCITCFHTDYFASTCAYVHAEEEIVMRSYSPG